MICGVSVASLASCIPDGVLVAVVTSAVGWFSVTVETSNITELSKSDSDEADNSLFFLFSMSNSGDVNSLFLLIEHEIGVL